MEFIAVDNPHATKLTVHVLAHEREACKHAAPARTEKADHYSGNVLPVIR